MSSQATVGAMDLRRARTGLGKALWERLTIIQDGWGGGVLATQGQGRGGTIVGVGQGAWPDLVTDRGGGGAVKERAGARRMPTSPWVQLQAPALLLPTACVSLCPCELVQVTELSGSCPTGARATYG